MQGSCLKHTSNEICMSFDEHGLRAGATSGPDPKKDRSLTVAARKGCVSKRLAELATLLRDSRHPSCSENEKGGAGSSSGFPLLRFVEYSDGGGYQPPRRKASCPTSADQHISTSAANQLLPTTSSGRCRNRTPLRRLRRRVRCAGT